MITGRVQGVGFRYFTQRIAVQHGIAGWVRNTSDGRVEIEAEGDASAMHEFEASVASGPAGALVEGVDAAPLAVGRTQSGFLIR